VRAKARIRAGEATQERVKRLLADEGRTVPIEQASLRRTWLRPAAFRLSQRQDKGVQSRGHAAAAAAAWFSCG